MGTFKAGFARVEITPKVPAYLAGYAMRNKPSEAVHDPLFLRTVVIDDGDTRIAIASNDLCLIDSDLISDLQKMIAEANIQPKIAIATEIYESSQKKSRCPEKPRKWEKAQLRKFRSRFR